MSKVPVIINKISKTAISDKNGEVRKSKKLMTNEHVIRDMYNLRKSYY